MAPLPIFSFDAETDGLYGDVWAIGAVLLSEDHSEPIVFGGQLDSDVITNDWVKQNVAPVVHLPQYLNRTDLLNAFWDFWMDRPEHAVCVADFGSPVESGLFRACVDLDMDDRQWKGPYPMHELGTALLAAGKDPDMDRRQMCGRPDLDAHNPVHDALASGLCWQQVVPDCAWSAA